MEQEIRHIHSGLIEKSMKGDRKAQYALYEAYADAMYNVCVRMVGSAADAEDVLQEAFVSAFRNLASFRGESTFGAWLKRIVVNRCVSFLRVKHPVVEYEEQDEAYDPNADTDTSDKRFYDIQRVKNGLRLLPEGYRQVIQLYLLEGYDHEEIGEILGISSSTSKSQYHRAKKKLISTVTAM